MSPPVWVLRPDDPAWPPGLADLGPGEPARLYGCGARDLVAGLAPGDAVTIVGSRRATPYGLQVATRLGRELATAGFVVVSGMANGIDAAAHLGALEASGRTVAVLAGGPDVPSPPGQRGLYSRILAAEGAVVSERKPGATPEPWAFPQRNRLMAALAEMAIVVEAAEPSGSRITADRALELGRRVGAVPGPVNSRVSAGTNALLYDGAQLVRDAQDVVDALIGIGAPRLRSVGPPLDAALEGLLAAVEAGNASVDAIAAASAGDARAVARGLVRLELLGYVRSDPPGHYTRTTLEPGPQPSFGPAPGP